MADNEKIIRDFIAAWARLNVDELASYFTEDGVYHNMPFRPVQGQSALKVFISNFLKDWTATDWEILTLVSSGDTVIAERLDRTKLGERSVDLPCCGVFELEGGKIKVWRDYFDIATYAKGASGVS